MIVRKYTDEYESTIEFWIDDSKVFAHIESAGAFVTYALSRDELCDVIDFLVKAVDKIRETEKTNG